MKRQTFSSKVLDLVRTTLLPQPKTETKIQNCFVKMRTGDPTMFGPEIGDVHLDGYAILPIEDLHDILNVALCPYNWTDARSDEYSRMKDMVRQLIEKRKGAMSETHE